jgi:outer membrane biosynthesis protein TonB
MDAGTIRPLRRRLFRCIVFADYRAQGVFMSKGQSNVWAVMLLAGLFTLSSCRHVPAVEPAPPQTQAAPEAQPAPQAQRAPQAQLAPEVQPASVVQPAPEVRPAPQAQTAPQPPLQAKPAPVPQNTVAMDVLDVLDAIQRDLEIYAVAYLETMNTHIKPSIRDKEVAPAPEGFRARYRAIDPASLATSYSVSENKAVAYVGRVRYHEVEYICLGKTREEALAGPFSEANRRPITEIVMHIRGKWTYRY